jgi:hypothetical protein
LRSLKSRKRTHFTPEHVSIPPEYDTFMITTGWIGSRKNFPKNELQFDPPVLKSEATGAHKVP